MPPQEPVAILLQERCVKRGVPIEGCACEFMSTIPDADQPDTQALARQLRQSQSLGSTDSEAWGKDWLGRKVVAVANDNDGSEADTAKRGNAQPRESQDWHTGPKGSGAGGTPYVQSEEYMGASGDA